jgi:hypothetical protein
MIAVLMVTRRFSRSNRIFNRDIAESKAKSKQFFMIIKEHIEDIRLVKKNRLKYVSNPMTIVIELIAHNHAVLFCIKS